MNAMNNNNEAFTLTDSRNWEAIAQREELTVALFVAETRMTREQPFSAVAIASEDEARRIFNQF